MSNILELNLKAGFNILVVYFDRHVSSNCVKVEVFKEINEMFEFICEQDKTVMTVYFAVCNAQGGILRGIAVPKSVRYRDYYEYKKKLHLEYCNG